MHLQPSCCSLQPCERLSTPTNLATKAWPRTLHWESKRLGLRTARQLSLWPLSKISVDLEINMYHVPDCSLWVWFQLDYQIGGDRGTASWAKTSWMVGCWAIQDDTIRSDKQEVTSDPLRKDNLNDETSSFEDVDVFQDLSSLIPAKY